MRGDPLIQPSITTWRARVGTKCRDRNCSKKVVTLYDSPSIFWGEFVRVGV